MPKPKLFWSLLVWAGLAWPSQAIAAATVSDRIVAVVNDEIVTQTEVSSRLHSLLASGNQPPPDVPQDKLASVVLERLIEQKLVLQEGRKLGIKISDEDVNRKLTEIKEKIGSDEAFETWLERQQLSMADLKKMLEDQLLAQRTIDQKVRSTISVSPQEVAAEVTSMPPPTTPDQVRVAHILIRVGASRTEEQARARLQEVQLKLAEGVPFADVARQYSDDPQAQQGGDLGWVTQGQLLPELDQAVFALKPGDVSQGIQTRLGFHVVQAVDKKSGEQLSAEQTNHLAFRKIYERKFEVALQKWLDDLKKQAYINIRPE